MTLGGGKVDYERWDSRKTMWLTKERKGNLNISIFIYIAFTHSFVQTLLEKTLTHKNTYGRTGEALCI